MSRTRTLVLIIVGVLMGALIGPGYAVAKDAVTSVLVTNTADNPVPVRGTVSVDEPVTVDGTVAVSDNREPFEVRLDLTWAAGAFVADVEHYQVPAGKRLVVEFAAASVGLPNGQTPLVSVNAGNGGTGYPIPLTLQGVGNGNAFHRGATSARDYQDAGTFIFPSAERQAPAGGAVSGTASGWVYLSGYLVPA